MPDTHANSVLGFWTYAAKRPDSVALIDPQGLTMTYGALSDRVNALSNSLQSRGYEPGDIVAIAMRNCFEFYEVILGCAQIGVDILTISTHLTPNEAQYILSDSAARGLVVDRELEPGFRKAAAAAGVAEEEIFVRGEPTVGTTPYEDLLAGHPTSNPPDRSAGVLLLYTSGTTGQPKGVRKLVGRAATPEAVYARHAAAMLDRFDWQVGDGRYLLAGPLYHRASSVHSLHSLMLGHSVVVVDKWEAERTLELIERFDITYSHMVPTMFHRLLALPAEIRNRYAVTSLRSVVHAAAPCPVHEKRAMIEWWGPVIYEYYAASEGGGTSVKPREWLAHPGTVGRPWAGSDVAVKDESGSKLLPADDIGSIWISLENQDFEYINDPEKTSAGRVDGWFTAGDMGSMDSEGWLYIADRRSDLIISGGVNIYPAEVESALSQHPDVDEVAVIGTPDEDWGQAVKAVVKLRDGAEPDEAALRAHARTQLSNYKCPRAYQFVEAIPRSEIGKILKRNLH